MFEIFLLLLNSLFSIDLFLMDTNICIYSSPGEYSYLKLGLATFVVEVASPFAGRGHTDHTFTTGEIRFSYQGCNH